MKIRLINFIKGSKNQIAAFIVGAIVAALGLDTDFTIPLM